MSKYATTSRQTQVSQVFNLTQPLLGFSHLIGFKIVLAMVLSSSAQCINSITLWLISRWRFWGKGLFWKTLQVSLLPNDPDSKKKGEVPMILPCDLAFLESQIVVSPVKKLSTFLSTPKWRKIDLTGSQSRRAWIIVSVSTPHWGHKGSIFNPLAARHDLTPILLRRHFQTNNWLLDRILIFKSILPRNGNGQYQWPSHRHQSSLYNLCFLYSLSITLFVSSHFLISIF